MNNRFFGGMAFIVVGILFLLHQSGIIPMDLKYIFRTYWPLFIVYFCLKGVVTRNKQGHFWNGSMIWNSFGVFIGLFLLGRNLGYITLTFGELIPYAVPIGLIIFGLSMIFRSSASKEAKTKSNAGNWHTEYVEKTSSPDATNNEQSTKENFKKKTNSIENRSSFIGDIYLGQDVWELQPMNISHFIGDTILDLTKAQISYGETKIVISAFIGDVKIFVPNDIELEISVTSSSFLGDSWVFKRREGGMFNSMKAEPKDYQIAEKRIRVIVSMFIGDLNVQRIG